MRSIEFHISDYPPFPLAFFIVACSGGWTLECHSASLTESPLSALKQRKLNRPQAFSDSRHGTPGLGDDFSADEAELAVLIADPGTESLRDRRQFSGSQDASATCHGSGRRALPGSSLNADGSPSTVSARSIRLPRRVAAIYQMVAACDETGLVR
jgi:hypothetical protein